jgi:hypothetical protein
MIRLNADGTPDAGFIVGAGFDSHVEPIAPATDGSGDIYVGGDFSVYDGIQVDRAVALNSDGSLD